MSTLCSFVTEYNINVYTLLRNIISMSTLSYFVTEYNINVYSNSRFNFTQNNKTTDVFGLLWATRGKHSSGPRGRQTLAGERGKGRVTEDRGRGVGNQIFPALFITKGRGEEQEYSGSTSYLPHLPFPLPPLHSEPEGRGGGQPAS